MSGHALLFLLPTEVRMPSTESNPTHSSIEHQLTVKTVTLGESSNRS